MLSQLFRSLLINRSNLDRVGVVRARPGRSTIALGEDVDQTDDRAVCAGNHEEGTDDDDERGPADHELPAQGAAVRSVPVVVEPHGAHGLETHESTEDGTHERDETAESGNARGDAVGDESGGGDAGDPSAPVNNGVGGQVLGVAHDADEDVFGGQVGVKDHGDHQTRQGEAVGDFLHQSTGATESRAGNVASAVVVDDDADDEVSADGDTAAKVEGADVVSGVPHLRGDGEVGGHTGEGEDEGAAH